MRTRKLPERFEALYARVSTRSQQLASQLPELRRYRPTSGLPAVLFEDKASGRSMARPGWDELWGHVLAGRVATIVVCRLDRLGRTVAGVSALLEDLQARGVGLVSLREGFDLRTPAGRCLAHVLLSFALYETELRGERVADGQAAARAEGKKWGGSKAGWRWKVTEEKERQVQLLHAAGETISGIARAVGLARNTVRGLLAKPADQCDDVTFRRAGVW